MKNFLFLITLPLLLPALALADASVSTDAGREIDNSQSATIKRDKSLSTDKSQGDKTTSTNGHDKTKEQSKTKSHATKISKSAEKSQSATVEININGLLLREFTSRYERSGTGTGMAGEYFGLCKPLTRAIADYPVVFANSNMEYEIAGFNEAIKLNPYNRRSQNFNGTVPPHDDTIVSRYIQCRITASFYLAEAGERAGAQKIRTESDVRDRIRQVFAEMDSDDSVFQNLRQRARDLWAEETCSMWLNQAVSFKSPEIQCGIFSFVGNSFTVENRETLSENSIDGHVYKIAFNSSESAGASEDDSVSNDNKVASSEHKGTSTDHFKENKKTASLNKSKSLDNSSSSTVDRSAGNSVSAAPKD